MSAALATGGFAVTPNDSTDLPQPARSLWVGGAGNVVRQCRRGGENLTFVGVPAGSVLPIAATRVLATSTTATSIIALL